jgi:hypothetical protein
MPGFLRRKNIAMLIAGESADRGGGHKRLIEGKKKIFFHKTFPIIAKEASSRKNLLSN